MDATNTTRIANILTALLLKQEPIEAFSMTELAGVYNLAVERLERPSDKIKSFRDKPTAVKRVTGVLVEIKSEPKASKAKANGATAPAPAAKAAKTPKAKTARGGSRSKVDGAKTIYLLIAGNPHRAGTKDFAKYHKLSNGMTVEAAVAKGVEVGYLTYANKRKLLEFR